MTEKVSEAQKRASKKWDDNNKERKQYINTRSVARNFIKKRATNDDIKELRELLKERENNLSH